ncbi:MAG: aminoacyl-histidine dipeptidase [Ignavibacteria bacterium]|jgi:dipeptidase D|nr:aminoacyl-histidine dipeptidase [Ignavibacteria bacterium]MCU7501461.1 aminoacyl-histidine dipeptidase [Ignavibacteria bacterium]MCU7516023.1 aminoacyl-histidine dipeptidase [Ignavibacteria bacterium]
MSKEAVEGLKPETLWQRFYEITQVPRPSKSEGKIREYLKDFAKKNNLQVKEDEVGNIVISAPAAPGYEKAGTVVLQGHVDMVCEKNKGTQHDFDNEGLKLEKDGEWIKARGTTLGADNGIGVAAALAVLTDKEIKRGPVECLFTIDEETGLTGANNIQPGFITGKALLNLDSEEDGAFYVGCAGGLDTQGIFSADYIDKTQGYSAYNLLVSGLKGGHSGMEINTGRANAIKVMGRVLKALNSTGLLLVRLEGGSKRNAIPREAEAVVLLQPAQEKAALEIIRQMEEQLKNEFKVTDNGLKIDLTAADGEYKKAFSTEFQKRLVNAILGLPHGVLSMSADIPGLVETSTNLATISMEGDKLVIGTSQRSSIESAKWYAAHIVESVLELAGAEIRQGDGYPGWKPDMNSEALRVSKKIFEALFNGEPEVKAIHAGLECGILGDKYPGLDMISFGPTIIGAHSPDERVNIPTVERFYRLLSGILNEYASIKVN